MRHHAIEMNWRVKPIKMPIILKGHDDHVITCLQFCGNQVVSGSDDNTLRVWSVITGKVSIVNNYCNFKLFIKFNRIIFYSYSGRRVVIISLIFL